MPVAVPGGTRPPHITIKKRRRYIVNSIGEDPEKQEILMEWAEFLVERVGREGARTVVESYVKMWWISPDVAEALLSYIDVLKVEEPDIPVPGLTPEDHRKSLAFVKRLAGL